jgi:flagellar hook assembly protein FlgD
VTESYRFLRNVPNPFHTTTIEFALTRHVDRVRLRIFDVDGRLVRTLVDGPAPAGATTKFWDGTDSRGRLLAPGFYFYRLEAPGVNETRRMLLLR